MQASVCVDVGGETNRLSLEESETVFIVEEPIDIEFRATIYFLLTHASGARVLSCVLRGYKQQRAYARQVPCYCPLV